MSQQGTSSLLRSLRMSQQGTSTSLQRSSLTRRTAFALGAALPFATARPSRAVIAGYDTTLSEAHQTGAVALWIDLTGCDVCRHDVPAACSGTLIADDLVLSAQHCVDIPETLNGKLTKVVFGTNIFDKKATSVPVAVPPALGRAGTEAFRRAASQRPAPRQARATGAEGLAPRVRRPRAPDAGGLLGHHAHLRVRRSNRVRRGLHVRPVAERRPGEHDATDINGQQVPREAAARRRNGRV